MCRYCPDGGPPTKDGETVVHAARFLVELAHPDLAEFDELRRVVTGSLAIARDSVRGSHVFVTAEDEPALTRPSQPTEPEWDDRPSLGAAVDAMGWALGQARAWLRGVRRG